ncbi:MAG: phytoene desaturase family protein [Candidatus Diapherotrites archaeon]
MKKIVVIGAGVGGLSAAIQLKRAGYEVEIIEKNNEVGGRLNKFEKNGFTFDTGPTLLLMPWVLKEFFKKVNRKIEDYLELVEIEPIYDVYLGNKNNKITISRKIEVLKKSMKKISEEDEKNLTKYLIAGKDYYENAKKHFLQKNVHKIQDIINLDSLKALIKIGFSQTYFEHVKKYFKNDLIKAAFSFQSIYVGASPTKIPAAYSLIQYVEITEGVWCPKGGMNKIREALEKIAKEENINIKKNTEAKKIIVKNNKCEGALLSNGEIITSDIILSNVDLPFTYNKLLEPNISPTQKRKLEYSCSAIVIILGIKRKLNIRHHTFILPENFLKSLEELFTTKIIPEDPGIYINCPSKTFPKTAPKNKESIYILIPVPNNQSKIDWKKEYKTFRKKIFEKIKKVLEIDLEEIIEFEKPILPEDWEKNYSLLYGSTFGLAPTLFQSAFFRPQNRDPKIKNLYFVGASTHPGSGIPIVLFSANNIVERIIEENPLR